MKKWLKTDYSLNAISSVELTNAMSVDSKFKRM